MLNKIFLNLLHHYFELPNFMRISLNVRLIFFYLGDLVLSIQVVFIQATPKLLNDHLGQNVDYELQKLRLVLIHFG